jgi:hypothetical protein
MSKLNETIIQVNDVTNIMKQNLQKVLDRDAKLSDLEDKSELLKDSANRFESTARKLKRKFWWQNIKYIIGVCIVIITLILLIVLILHPW